MELELAMYEKIDFGVVSDGTEIYVTIKRGIDTREHKQAQLIVRVHDVTISNSSQRIEFQPRRAWPDDRVPGLDFDEFGATPFATISLDSTNCGNGTIVPGAVLTGLGPTLHLSIKGKQSSTRAALQGTFSVCLILLA